MLTKLATIYVAVIISFCLGIFLSRVEDGKLIVIRNYIDEFYAFAIGHTEEETSFINKVKSEITNKKRIDIMSGSEELKNELETISRQDFEFENGKRISAYQTTKTPVPALATYIPFDAKRGILVIIEGDKVAYFRQILDHIDFQIDSEKNELLILSNKDLRNYDLCSETPKWIKSGVFHHYFNANSAFIAVLGTQLNQDVVKRELALDDRRIYSDANHNISIFSRASGMFLTSFDFEDIARANIEKFDPLVLEKTKQNKKEIIPNLFVNTKDYWHPNSVAMFPKNFTSEQFDYKDALVSAKGYNLVFVVDIETLEIKFYSQGTLQGQHDANWYSGSSFSVFNNRHADNPKGEYSQIKLFDFEEYEWSTMYDGSESKAITNHSGGHSILGGFASMTLTKQGRHIIVDLSKQTVASQYFLMDEGNIINTQEAKLVDSTIVDKIKGCKNWNKVFARQIR